MRVTETEVLIRLSSSPVISHLLGQKGGMVLAKVHLQLHRFLEGTMPAGRVDSYITTCIESCPFSLHNLHKSVPHINPNDTRLINCQVLVWLWYFNSWVDFLKMKVGKEKLKRGAGASWGVSFQKQCICTSLSTFCWELILCPGNRPEGTSTFVPLSSSRPVFSYVNLIWGLIHLFCKYSRS